MKAYRYSIVAFLLIAFAAASLNAQVITITDVSSTPTTCSDGSDGTISFTFTGGVGPYEWYIYEGGGSPVDTGGPTTDTVITSFGRRKFASHVIVIEDVNEDVATTVIAVDGPQAISISTFGSTDITCNNANDGTISVTATGESGSYYFDLAGPVNLTQTSGNFIGLPEGDYTVTVRDQGSCTTTDVTPTLAINNPTLVSAVLDNITDAACFGEATGSISITPTGGSPSGTGTGYSYAWTGPSGFTSTTEDIINVVAGNYFVAITDGNGCTSNMGPYTVGQPLQINATLDASTDVLCNLGNDGTANISVSGGAGGYIFSWIGQVNGLVSNDENPVNLVADTYDLIIEDLDGCTRIFPSFVTIDEPMPLSISVDAVNDASCNGSSDGSALITPGGGTPPYNYLWSGASFGYTSTQEDPTGMPADNYSLTITDGNGCSRVYPNLLTIGEPFALMLTLDGFTDVGCFGGNDGTADITVTGGSPPYVFSWVGAINGPASSVEDPTDLRADTYSLFILDNNGCFISSFNFLTIDQPPGIGVTVDLVTHVDCNGDATGAIEITPAGGTPAYNFLWEGPNGYTSTDEDPIGLSAGDYSLTISDNNGCIGDYNNLVTILENPPLTANFAIIDLNCGDPLPSNDGAIDVTVSGGVPGYTYAWTGPSGFTSSAEDLSALLPGSYVLEVTDNLGCVMTFPAQTVAVPPLLDASATQVDIDCYGAGDGSIDLTVTGGTAPYAFAWTGPSGFTATTEDIVNLEAGAYGVTVTDSHGCPVPFVNIATITEAAEILVSAMKTDVSCAGDSTGTIDITVTGGVAPYSFAWTGPSGFTATTEDLSDLPAGIYNLDITDANGCMVSFPALETILEPPPITVSYTQVDVSSCFGALEGSISATGAGGTGTILYSLDGSVPDISGNFINLTGGYYNLTLTDQNGCTLDTLVEILSPPELLINDITANDVSGCSGDSNGSLVVSASGGTGILEYSLNDVTYQSSSTFIGLPAGDYTVFVKDANGCTVSTQDTINEPDPLSALVITSNVTFGALGTITITGSTGGVPPYEYSITGSGGTFTPDTAYSDLSPATYPVVLRDQNGCTFEETVEVLDIQPMQMVTNLSHVRCYGDESGSIRFLPQDAVGPVRYSIDSGAHFVYTPLFENLPGDSTYILVAVDSLGKVFTGPVTLTEPLPLTFSHTVTPAECNVFSPTGAVDVTVTGGTGSYRYAWSDGSMDEDRTSLLAGTYTLEVADAFNCQLNELIIVSSDVVVNVYAGKDTSVCFGESIQLSGMGDFDPVWEPAGYLDQDDILNPTTVPITDTLSFTLTITETVSPYACYNTDTVTVTPYPEVGIAVTPDTFVLAGSSAQLEVTGGPFIAYRWVPETTLSNSSIANPIATPGEATRYYVFATNEYGCEEVDSVFIDVMEDITIFNVFSPNGDGINEYFEIEHAERFPEMLVEVYSRWGDLLFSTMGYDSGSRWDGRARGKEAPVGTYYYVIVPYPGAKAVTGHVTIIR